MLAYGEAKEGYYSGMLVYERPDRPHPETMKKVEEIKRLPDPQAQRDAMRQLQDAGAFGTYRMFVGKNESGSALIELADRKQRPRLQMSVDSEGNPHLTFFDPEGNPTYTLPPKKEP